MNNLYKCNNPNGKVPNLKDFKEEGNTYQWKESFSPTCSRVSQVWEYVVFEHSTFLSANKLNINLIWGYLNINSVSVQMRSILREKSICSCLSKGKELDQKNAMCLVGIKPLKKYNLEESRVSKTLDVNSHMKSNR